MKDWRIALAAAIGTAALIGTAQAITDSAFNYSTAKVGYYSINPEALAPENGGIGYSNSFQELDLISGITCFSTGLNLPQGSKMQTAIYWYASGNGVNPNIQLHRQQLSDGAILAAAFQGADNSGTRKQAS